MKAYKQINYSFENKVVFSYAGMLCLLGFFILLSPVFAQEDEHQQKNEPKVHYDVKKEYDKDGNLTGYDSTYSWQWSGEGWNMPADSMLEQLNQHFRFLDGPWDWSGMEPFHNLGPNDRQWFWNDGDSSVLNHPDSTYNKYLFDEPWSNISPMPGQWNFPFNDSIGLSFFGFDDLSKLFDEGFDMNQFNPDKKDLKKYEKNQDEFLEKFREYQKEQQKLFEKYFGKPEDSQPDQNGKPQNLKSPQKLDDPSRIGKV